MGSTTFALFTDTGGILVLDPANAAELDDEFVSQLNVALDPDGDTEQAVEHDGDWPGVWSEAASRLRRSGRDGRFTLILSGEGTFHVRVQFEDLGAEERALVVASFEECVRVRSGRLAFTDGGEFFGEELPGGGANFVEAPEGLYSLRIHHLDRPPSSNPIVGVYGSDEWPALVVRLLPAESCAEAAGAGEAFPRLTTSRQGYEEPRPGWRCYAQVTKIEGGEAQLELMLTETVYSGYARMDVPPGEDLSAGDYVLVTLLEDAGGYWKAEWRGEPS